MEVKTYLFRNNAWNGSLDASMDSKNTLIILFGTKNISKISNAIENLIEAYPNSTLVGSSTSGEIYGNEIFNDSLSVAVLKFEKSNFRTIVKSIDEENSYEAGESIVDELLDDNLKSIFILSNALNVNGSELTRGLNKNIPNECVIAGGLAGDGIEFGKTWIMHDSKLINKDICAVGFYGDHLHINYGCKCGWRRFGLDRKVTHSENNILYTLDNKPALELYKKYLGEHASKLPVSGLHFPLMLLENGANEPKLRAIKAIDEKNNAIILSANIPQNSIVSIAKANLDDLIDGAQEAAENLKIGYDANQKALCIGISCIARKIVLKQEAEDEIEVVNDVLGENVSTIGFYSYGEISTKTTGGCDFHNQTMTLMLIHEI